MTKKEQAKMEALLTRSALRATSDVKPDVMPPGYRDNGLRKGFLFNAYTCTVDPACTSSIYHSCRSDEKTDSQQPRPLFSTRLLALRALRYAVEQKAAAELRKVDRLIEEEETK